MIDPVLQQKGKDISGGETSRNEKLPEMLFLKPARFVLLILVVQSDRRKTKCVDLRERIECEECEWHN